MTNLAEVLQTVEVGDPVALFGLQVFPLRWRQAADVNYTTLDEAVREGNLEVTEVTESGSVPQLRVTNKGEVRTFLMAGEQLSGGKQNRVLNASIMVAPHSELPIPVSCVERGRWGYRSPNFSGCGSSSNSRLRKTMHSSVTRHYRASGTARCDQGAVWNEVDRKITETCGSSPTSVLQDAYESTTEWLNGFLDQLDCPTDASGVVFAYDGKIVGFDLFDHPATLAKLWPKLLRAYAIDVPKKDGDVPVVNPDQIRTWIHSALQAKAEVFQSPGLGEDVRMEGGELIAAGLVVDDHPVHIEAFANTASKT